MGSYVYNVNQVIHNMLYENDGYNNIVSRWAEASGYFALFAILAIKIVRAIQWILQKLYGLVNKSYMALSREMEFQADVWPGSPVTSRCSRLYCASPCPIILLTKYCLFMIKRSLIGLRVLIFIRSISK